MPAERVPAVTVNCDCNNVVLEAYELNPEFIVCHCELCQLVHAGPGFGAHCNGIKIVEGAERITMYKSDRVPMATWHFCSRCGTKLYFTFDEDVWRSPHDKYVLSVGTLHGNEASKKVAAGMRMAREAFYDLKPPYYQFGEQTDRMSTEQTAEYYKAMSQADAANPIDSQSWYAVYRDAP